MRVVMIGSNWAHSWATESHVARDFMALGHDVHKVSERLTLDAIEAACSECDLVVYMKSVGLPDDAFAMWGRLRNRGVATASYHLDLYYGLPRQDEIGNDPFWRTHDVFTADGDPEMQAYCESLGIRHHWLPAACVSDEVRRGTYRDKFAYPICFVGKAVGYHTQWPWRQQMLDALRQRYKDQFKVWTHADQIWDMVSNDVYASTKVVVGDSLALPGHRNYWSNRYYETVGRGGLLVAPAVPGIDGDFRNGVDLLLHESGDLDSLFAMIDLGVSYDREARAMVTGYGMKTVAARHTYKHRIATMLDALGMGPRCGFR